MNFTIPNFWKQFFGGKIYYNLKILHWWTDVDYYNKRKVSYTIQKPCKTDARVLTIANYKYIIVQVQGS